MSYTNTVRGVLAECWAVLHYVRKSNPSFSFTSVTNNGIGFLLALLFPSPFYPIVANCSAVFFSGSSISFPLQLGEGYVQHEDGSQGIQRCTCQKPSPGSGKALLN